MRKSVWLLSAGLIALSFPAQALAAQQEVDVPDSPETDTDDAAAEPTQGSTAEGAAVDDQAVEPDTTMAGAGEIVVTATRRNEALSDVPLAVSAVTAETLEYTGASDIRQLNQVSPSLLVSSTQSEAGAGVARIRGVGTVGDNPGLESSVAVFIDGVYRSRTGMGLTELGPLDRIEVLRGPQGTLFGRNASAGLISVITAKPLFSNMFAAEGTIGNYDLRRLEGSATGPISESFAARVDAVYMQRDGFLEDVISGRDVNDRNRWMIRAQGLYEPADNLSVRLVGDYTQRREECCAAPYLPAHDTARVGGNVVEQPSTIAAIERALGAVINDDPFERKISITPGRDYDSDVDDWGVSAEVVYDFGPELTSITAYRFNDYVRGQDADFNNLDILFRDSDGGAANRFKTLTQELRLQGEAMGGALDWLVGGYFADEDLRVDDNLSYGEDYSEFGNCLVAGSFAAAAPTILAPGASPTCFNTAVATGVRNALIAQFNAAVAAGNLAAANAIAGQITALGAFARLNNSAFLPAPINFTLPVFGTSGFANLATAFGLPGQTLDGVGLDDRWQQNSTNWALFTHNIFTIMPGLDLTVGARYTRERKELEGDLSDNNTLCTFFSGGPLSALQQLPCVTPSAPGGFTIDDSKTEGKLSGTVVLSYQFDDILTYASYSRGYKAGGFNLDRAALRRSNGNGAICVTATQAGCGGIAASGDDLKFAPEINDAIELGMKYNGVGVDVNVALFHQLFRDFQLNTFNGLNFVVENINSCEDDLSGADEDNDPASGVCTGDTRAGVRSMGVELEVFTRPLPDVNWNFGTIFADTRYRDNLVGSDGRPLTNALFQLPGRRISNSNQWTVTSSLAWTPRIGGSGLRGLFYVDARHMSEFNTGSDLDIEKVQDGFTVFNGRIGIHGPDRMWGVEVWGQNLLDEDFMQVAFDAPIQGSGTERGVRANFYPRSTQLFGAFLGEPRSYGLTLRGRF
jgi:iron complex outermembrane receptor protein